MTFILCRAINKDFALIRLHIKMSFTIVISPLAISYAAGKYRINTKRNPLAFDRVARALPNHFYRDHDTSLS